MDTGTEAEVSAVIVFLLSEAAAFITGETIGIHGGATLVNGLWTVPTHDRVPAFQPIHRVTVPKALQGEGE